MLKSSLSLATPIFLLSRSLSAGAEPIKLAYNSDWLPYSFSVGKSVAGILPDVMREIIEKRMSQRIVQTGSPWKRVQLQDKKGLADAFVTVPTMTRLTYALSKKILSIRLRCAPLSKKTAPPMKVSSMIRVSKRLTNFAFATYWAMALPRVFITNIRLIS